MQRQHPDRPSAQSPGRHDPAALDWREAPGGRVPVSLRFADPYYSLENGLAETRHVFLDGNGLPARFAAAPPQPTSVAELGFGTGLNLLVTWADWAAAGARAPLRFTSFEAFPMSAPDMVAALAAFPELAPLAARLTALYRPGDDAPLALAPGLTLQVIHGDARGTLPRWDGRADAWFLDGFAPARNPELWEPALLAEVARHTRPGGTAASYSAAGHVRRALADAGFEVTRLKGYGRKRHMTRAELPVAPPAPGEDPSQAGPAATAAAGAAATKAP